MNTTTLLDPCAAMDPRAFRRALGNFATGVTVVTASAGGRRVGVTANSFNSVSLDPPLVLWSIDKRSGSQGVFEEATHFAVNVLASGQVSLSNHFARFSEDKFAQVPARIGVGGCLLLEDTSASFQCEKYQTLDGGDHWILIGRVMVFEDHGRAPLLYHQGAYAMVMPHPEMERKDEATPLRSGFQRRLLDNLYYLMTQSVRSYQEAYQPEQSKSGWRPSEARLLMILDANCHMDLPTLVREAAIPNVELEQAIDLLRSRDLLDCTAAGYVLTSQGEAQAKAVWARAKAHQDKVFAQFSADELHTFKKVLRGVIGISDDVAS